MTPTPDESPKTGYATTDSQDAIYVSIDITEPLTFHPRPKPPAAPPAADSKSAEGDKPAE